MRLARARHGKYAQPQLKFSRDQKRREKRERDRREKKRKGKKRKEKKKLLQGIYTKKQYKGADGWGKRKGGKC